MGSALLLELELSLLFHIYTMLRCHFHMLLIMTFCIVSVSVSPPAPSRFNQEMRKQGRLGQGMIGQDGERQRTGKEPRRYRTVDRIEFKTAARQSTGHGTGQFRVGTQQKT